MSNITVQDNFLPIDFFRNLQSKLVSPDFRDMSNVWSGLGAKYLPSVLYRFKTIPIEHNLPAPEIPSIKSV